MRKYIVVAVLLAFILGGCMRIDEDETELFREATMRLGELEDTLADEREAYSNNYSLLTQKLDLKKAQYSAEITKLNTEIAIIRKEMEELNNDSREMKSYIVVLQHRLDTIQK